MNIPMSWLREYIDFPCENVEEFVEKMTLSGSKVESVEHKNNELANIVVGKILTIVKHKDADKLVVTTVDVGESSPIQIVTGATNINVGDFIPIALDGATITGGVKIKKGKLRGETSDGMMCSIEELGYTTQDYPDACDDGIYILDKVYELGADVRPILQLCEDIVEFEITSNRPDCFSVLGLAREAAATYGKGFKYPVISLDEKGSGDACDMVCAEIQNPELCPRYVARVVKNVKIEPSPLWMRHRLSAAGVRPINNIVDITNYVMLAMGQPMHAFDIENIKNQKIIVRNAKDKETFTTLDGEQRVLDPSMLVIADCEKAVAIAGVMGGENSKVTQTASAILFEAANFNGTNIRLTSKKLGLRTDSSGKFEKGIDPNLALEAINFAMQLVEMLGCGEVVKGVVDCYPNKRETWSVTYSKDRVNRLLGTNLTEKEIEDYLKRVEIIANGGVAQIPTFRPDVEMEADIIEEVARLYGYDKIAPTLATGTPTVGKKNFKQNVEDIIKNTMISYGLFEALTFSFESPKVFDKLLMPQDACQREAVKIANPLGEDFSVMRTTTINGMLQSLSVNYNRRNNNAELFELGKIYIPKSLPMEDLPVEIETLTIGLYGKHDFFSLKGIVEGLLTTLGIKDVSYEAEKNTTYMHPGRCANIIYDGEIIGYLGEVHPTVADNYEIGTKVYVATLNATKLYENANLNRSYEPLPKYPGTTRDISMLVKDDVPVKVIEVAIREKGGKILKDAKLFDVYKGEQIQEGHKSVSFALSFRAADRTLTEEEITPVLKKILENLEVKLGALLRDK